MTDHGTKQNNRLFKVLQESSDWFGRYLDHTEREDAQIEEDMRDLIRP